MDLKPLNQQTIDSEIRNLLKLICKPQVAVGLLRDMDSAEAFERKVLRARKKGVSDWRQKDGRLADGDRLEHLITLCQKRLEKEEAFRVFLGVGDLFKFHGDLRRAEELYTMVLRGGSRSGQREPVAEAYMRRGEVYSRQGRWSESASDLDQSREIYKALREHLAIGRIENILGTSCAEQGKLKQAQGYFSRALAMFEKTKDTNMTGAVLMNIGIIHNIIGQHDLALAHYKRAQSQFEQIGDLNRLAELHHNMGMSYLSMSAFNDAIREFDSSLAFSSKSQNVNLVGLASLGKANVYFRLRDFTIAFKLVDRAAECSTGSGDRLSLADAYKLKGMIHREMKRFSIAESYLQTSQRINLELNNGLNAGETYFEMGLLEQKRGRKKEALVAFEHAYVFFKKVGAQSDVQRTEQALRSMGNKGR